MDSHLHLRGMFEYQGDPIGRKHQHPMNRDDLSLIRQLCVLFHKTLLLLHVTLNLESFLALVDRDNHLHLLACIEYQDDQVSHIRLHPMKKDDLQMSALQYEHHHMQFE
jgi:hypothetical protein